MRDVFGQKFPLAITQEGINGALFDRFCPQFHVVMPPNRAPVLAGAANMPVAGGFPDYRRDHAPVTRPWIGAPASILRDERRGIWRLWAQAIPPGAPAEAAPVWAEFASPDLINWVYNRIPFRQDLPDCPDMLGGCVVIDHGNTSGFGAGSVIYFVTSRDNDDKPCITRWVGAELGIAPLYAGIVLKGAQIADSSNIGAARISYDQEALIWVMAASMDGGIAFLTSADTESWTFKNLFPVSFRDYGAIDYPDLCKITPVDGVEKWALFFSCQGTDNTGPNMACSIGWWDGDSFRPDGNAPPALLNCGSDFYGGTVLAAGEKTLLLARMFNHHYADTLPTSGYRNNLSIALEMQLVNENGSYRPGVNFPAGLEKEFSATTDDSGFTLTQDQPTHIHKMRAAAQSWFAEIQLGKPLTLDIANEIQVDFCVGAQAYTRLSIKPGARTVTLDRTQSGAHPAEAAALAQWNKPCTTSIDNASAFHIQALFDGSALEIVLPDRKVFFCSLIFPPEDATGLRISIAGAGAVRVDQFTVSY